MDQHGSRFIQQKLVTCSDEEKASVLGEVVPNAFKLMTDVFGNYVIQKVAPKNLIIFSQFFLFKLTIIHIFHEFLFMLSIW